MRRRRRPVDWRHGGRSVRRWDTTLLSIALLSVGVGVFAAGVAARFLPEAPVLSSAALWAGLAVAVGAAYSRGRPAGLLRFRPIDILWGVALGLAARLAQGILTSAGSTPFPVSPDLQRGETWLWTWQTAVPAGLVGPVLEEFFFRAVVLVSVYELLRRAIGPVGAACTALSTSACGFAALHLLFAPLAVVDGVALVLLGTLAGLLVLLTGRIWAAVTLHSVYNLVYLSLVVANAALR